MLTKLLKYSQSPFSFVTKMAEKIVADTQLSQRVQNNVLNQAYAIQHQAKLRQRVNLQNSIASLQKQLRQQIAKSLKRSQDKTVFFIEKAKKLYEKGKNGQMSSKQVEEYNALVAHCEKVRWEFMVHRQSCGFTIQNYQLVTSLYPIPPKILQS